MDRNRNRNPRLAPADEHHAAVPLAAAARAARRGGAGARAHVPRASLLAQSPPNASPPMDAASIRVDAKLVPLHKGKIVRIIGKCQLYDAASHSAMLDSNGPLDVVLNPGELLTVNHNYELIAKVSPDATAVRVLSTIELSDNLDFAVAAKLVEYVHKVPELYF